MRKPAFCICENKDADQLLCFRYIDTTIPLLSKSEIQASSYLLWLYSPVCVGPGQKPGRPVFSLRGSFRDENLCKGLLQQHSWLQLLNHDKVQLTVKTCLIWAINVKVTKKPPHLRSNPLLDVACNLLNLLTKGGVMVIIKGFE